MFTLVSVCLCYYCWDRPSATSQLGMLVPSRLLACVWERCAVCTGTDPGFLHATFGCCGSVKSHSAVMTENQGTVITVEFDQGFKFYQTCQLLDFSCVCVGLRVARRRALLALLVPCFTPVTVPSRTASCPGALHADPAAHLLPDGQIKGPLSIITISVGEANSSCQKWLQIAALSPAPPFTFVCFLSVNMVRRRGKRQTVINGNKPSNWGGKKVCFRRDR